MSETEKNKNIENADEKSSETNFEETKNEELTPSSKKDGSEIDSEEVENLQGLEQKLKNINTLDSKEKPYIQDISENNHIQSPENYTDYIKNERNADETSHLEGSKSESLYKWNFSDYENVESTATTKNSKKSSIIFNIIIILVLAVAVFFIVYGFIKEFNPSTDTDLSLENPKNNTLTSQQPEYKSNIEIIEHEDLDNGLSASAIYEQVSPSVVGIQTYNTELYGNVPENEGSGVIMSADGLIVTNSHVIYLAKTIKVTLLNGESYTATLIGEDKYTDLGVIKLDNPPKNLIAAEFGDSENLKIGDRVVAIGNPGGLEFAGSTTQGIISGLERKVSDATGFSIKAIQVDAAINPGNSGGALINRFGQVIGITSSKISGTSFEGMGFALPIHKAKPIIDEIIAIGRVPGRALIGITYIPDKFIDTERAQKFDLQTGIIVESVDEKSDASKKGVLVGDIIHKIDNNVIQHLLDISEAIDGKKPGDSITLTIYRFETKDGPLVEKIIEIALMEELS